MSVKEESVASSRARSSSLSSSSSESRVSRTAYRSQSCGTAKTRSRSRSVRSTPHGDRVLYSGRHLDDQSVYHSDDDAKGDDDVDSDLSGDGPVLEVRGGIVNERDVDLEANQQPTSELEKSKTGRSDRSRQDRTLVCVFAFYSCGVHS